MLHLEILANLIILLQGNPIYGGRYNTADRFWNSTYVYYGNNITHQLENDLESEYKAIQNYKRHIGIIKDPYVQAVLKRIIKDEELHVVLFKDAINNLNNKI
jgi:bacterioferritin